MKSNLLIATVVAGLLAGGFFLARAQPPAISGPASGGDAPANTIPMRQGMALDHLAQTLNLTPEQKAKIQPVFEQAKPQLMQIYQEASQKSRTVIESAMAQIRPMLTPDQQAKLDQMKQAHQRMPGRPMQDATGQGH